VKISLARVFGTLLSTALLTLLGWTAGSGQVLAQASGAEAETPAQPAPAAPLRLESVIVALQELGGGTEPSGALDRLATTLEQGGIKVVERVPLGDASVERGEGSESALRERARKSGADAVVLARIAQVGQSTNLDLRVLPASGGAALSRLSLPVEVSLKLDGALDSAAQEVLQALRMPAPSESAATEEPVKSLPPSLPEGAIRVLEVAVSGNRRIDADAIRAVAATREGGSFSRRQVAEDVKRIYELGFFRDVKVLADPLQDGVRIEFKVDENPIIRRVTLSGNENLDSDDIKEKLTLTVGSTIDYPLVIENRERIKAYYQTKGYYTAGAEYQVEPLEEGAVAVNYEVSEGEQLKLREIEFEGNSFMDDDELMDGFQTKTWGLFSFVTKFWDNSGMYAEPVFYQDLDKAQRKYQDQGFIRARMSDPEVTFDEDGLRVKVRVDEGPQFKVGEINVQGDDSMDSGELTKLVQLKQGEVFNRSMLSDDVERLRLHYADLGYFSAEVRPRTDVDPNNLTVNCVFEAEKGNLYFVDRIDVAGNTRTRDDVVRRELSLVEGELYSAEALRRSQARVRRLGFFEEVNIEPREVEGGKVAIDVDVVERPTGAFSFGAGFGSTDGFLLNGSIRQDNLFGKGYGLNLQADLGSRNQRASFRFTDPFLAGTPIALGTGYSFSGIEFEDFDQSVSALSLDFSYPLDEGETRVGTGYSFSDREIDGFNNNDAASLLQREEFGGKSTTSLIQFQGSRDTRDDPRNTKRGQTTGFTLEFAGLGGVNEFLRLEARTTRYMPMKLFGRDSVFVFNTRAGYALPFNSISDFDLDDCGLDCTNLQTSQRLALSNIDDDLELPLSERFILGGVGAFQVRGFETRSLGPRRTKLIPEVIDGRTFFRPVNRNIDGGPNRCIDGTDNCNDIDDEDIDDFEDLDLTEVVGGNKMFLANFELRVPISEDYGVTGIWFFDTGNAFAETESFNPAELRFGTGLGAEWLSPFGPLVVYLGVPLDRLEDEKAAVFEFSLGGSSF
jgi:outer membrane protein insertion porin family